MTWEVMAATPCAPRLPVPGSRGIVVPGELMPTFGRLSALTLIALGLTVAATARAQPAGSGGAWANYPSPAEIAAAAPDSARTGQGGRAVASCHVEDSGELSRCGLLRETPAGQGVGAALLAFSAKFRRSPPGPKDLREVVIDADWFRVDAPTTWQQRPTQSELMAVYPSKGRGIDGRAVVSCLVTVQGALADCEAVSENPVGLGFGNAAIALTPQFTMKPVTWRGAPARTTVRIPINWKGFAGLVGQPGSRRVVPANLPWTEAPSFADVAAAYPKKARAEKRAGHVALSCDMSPEGRLVGCIVGAADPSGLGFEGAAKDLAKKFRFAVATDADRKATRDITVHVPVTFDPAALDQAVIGKPSWAGLPKAEQMQTAFAGLGVTGTARVMLECTVEQGGGVSGCRVATEDPAGKGIGAAALALAPAFRLTTWTAEGLPTVGGTVRIPIRYEGGAAPDPGAK